ncbi:MAG: TIGR03936 family radical SAM-associated protein [Atribacterota bacterium]
MTPSSFRYRLRQIKLHPFHLISQLDLNRLWDRVLRRAKLPILFSQGFNPRPLLSFGPATALGIESRAEFLEMIFAEEIMLDAFLHDCNHELPPEMQVMEITQIPPGMPSLMQSMEKIRYSFFFPQTSGEVNYPSEWLLDDLELFSVDTRRKDQYMVSCFFRGKRMLMNPRKIISYIQENHPHLWGDPIGIIIIKEEICFRC